MSAMRNDSDGDQHDLARHDLDKGAATAGDRAEGVASEDEGPPAAAAARARLAALRRDAAAAYDAIIAADDELRGLAGHRVAAERALLAAGQRRDQAASALDEDARTNPGLRARLAARLWARTERRARRAALTAALDGCAHSAEAARRAYARSQDQFAATVAARAEAAARLRGLTEECAAAKRAANGAVNPSASGSEP
jgi:hypothetical protein